MKKTDTNEWVKLESPRKVKVGLTKEAAEALGDIVFVKLPKVGELLQADSEVAVLESVKAAADSYSPFGGKIVSINTKLLANPELVNKDPLGEGWLYEIEFDDEERYHTLEDLN